MLSAWAEYKDFKSEIACGATSLDLVFVYRIIYPHTPCRRITYPPEQGPIYNHISITQLNSKDYEDNSKRTGHRNGHQDTVQRPHRESV